MVYFTTFKKILTNTCPFFVKSLSSVVQWSYSKAFPGGCGPDRPGSYVGPHLLPLRLWFSHLQKGMLPLSSARRICPPEGVLGMAAIREMDRDSIGGQGPQPCRHPLSTGLAPRSRFPLQAPRTLGAFKRGEGI